MKRFTPLLTLALSLCLSLAAQAAQELTLAVTTKAGVSQSVAAEKFKEKLEPASKGRYQVKLIQGAQAGGEVAIINAVKAGQINLAVVNSGPLDNFLPEVKAVEYPFLFASHQQAYAALDGAPGRAVLAGLEKAGFKGLAFCENGFRHLSNNLRPISTVADVQGLRIRVMESALHQRLWQLLGAQPLRHRWPINELLASGGADGQENPLEVFWAYRLDEQQKYLSLTGHVYSAPIALANLAWFNSLAKQDRKLLGQAMRQACQDQRGHARAMEVQALASLKQTAMQINEQPDLASFRQRAGDLARDPAFASPALKKLLARFREAAKQAR